MSEPLDQPRDGTPLPATTSPLSSTSTTLQRIGASRAARAALVELALDFALPGSVLYQIGDAVGGLLPELHAVLANDIAFVSMSHSTEQLQAARGSLTAASRSVQCLRAQFNEGIVVRDASVAVLAGVAPLTRPDRRARLLSDVYRGLREGGCALVMELVRSRDSLLNNLFAGHAPTTGWPSLCRAAAEILQSAATLDEEFQLMTTTGFRSVELFYKRHALCGLIAIK